ncbi:hypothetical protein [Streptomyces sp. NPDC049879]|uniref:hypothetical protein n=1 Tax=Streptomyces sp. NPDC049879 TaxID=3365598 RepID=UPI0037A8F270
MQIRKRVALAAAALLIAAAAPAAQAAGESANAPAAGPFCYDLSIYFWGEAGTGPGDNAHWPDRGKWREVWGDCDDINVSLDSGRYVRVCTRNKCHGWVWAPAHTWTVVFYNSREGADYYLQFQGTAAVNGYLAD